jgi:hypothetical protein
MLTAYVEEVTRDNRFWFQRSRWTTERFFFALDRKQWRALLITVVNIRVPLKKTVIS